MYCLEPEVAGEIGGRTIMDVSFHPPIVNHLHFIFKGWMGDDLLECFPVFLVSEKLKEGLHQAKLSGFKIEEFEIELDENFKILQPIIVLPKFFWIKIIGKDSDDFKIENKKLFVSSEAFSVLNKFNLKHCYIKKYDKNL